MLRQRVGIAKELIRMSQTKNADLIVAGAYGHTRLGEWVFGGVTRDLLTSSPVCCLLALTSLSDAFVCSTWSRQQALQVASCQNV
jgi:hypothetical protein